MEKKLTWKITLIIAFVIFAVWTLYPANKTLKPGLDLAGGTSLIYEIDAQGLLPEEKKGLSSKMITILRRRIDPANIQNLVWRPQGNTRFEIQMPLANAESRQKRKVFEEALSDLLAENINSATIMRSLSTAPDQRQKQFEEFAKNSPERLTILNDLADAYDHRKSLQVKRDQLAEKLKAPEEAIVAADLDLTKVKSNVGYWTTLKSQKLQDALNKFSEDKENVALLGEYVKAYGQWAAVAGQLTDDTDYKNAKRQLDKLSLTEEMLNYCLEMSSKLAAKRKQTIEQLKTEFSDRAEKIAKVVAAFDDYRPYRGGLDDPKDLQRMLKGAGILEFRILPTIDRPELAADEIETYVQSLKTKGPKFASDNKYVWCEIENFDEWKMSTSIVADFGDKFYVLASNLKNEAMLRSSDPKKQWKLKSARPTQDTQGRRAIGFTLDERGGKMFSKVTGNNIDRPLCILLDSLAISAPNIQVRIRTSGIITGSYSQTEVSDMVNKLNAGSLPARLIEPPISVKTIGPLIGAENRDKGIKAGLIGFVVVIVCMLSYYTLAGSVADVALIMNLLFVLAIMAFVRATFTLPGIAGIILTIGMSVDANVLIFERIREEQRKGSSLRIAIQNGYQKAFRTIMDANITTFITAAILFWVASEEIKGFAIVLMLGIASSMFTALFVTRVIFDFLLSKRIIKDHLVMMQLVKKPNIDWMKLRPVFLTISTLLIVSGLTVFFTRDNLKNNKYDIEFTGGTSVQINLKQPDTRQNIEDKIRQAGLAANYPALAAANVYSVGKSNKQFEINTTETNKIITQITFSATSQTVETITAAIGNKLKNLVVTQIDNPSTFKVTTSQANKSVVKDVLRTAFPQAELSESKIDEIVNNVILNAFSDQLQIQLNLGPEIISEEKITEELIDAYPELSDFIGGLKITCELQKTATADEIDSRMKSLRFKPDVRELNWYNYRILGSDLNPIASGQSVNSFVFLSVEPEAGFRELTEQQWNQFVENERMRVLAATQLETSLPRVTQINPSVGAEAKTQAIIAIVLSLLAIVTYIWIRFGSVRYGLAAIAALVHDVSITLGAVTACTYLASTSIGQLLLIGDFKISLAIVAAFLTLIGYSLNDTIVIFDRIRENRRKDVLNATIINNSINQTLSRTLLTSFTTFIVVLIMYIFGGQSLRGFTFSIGLGIIIGTYSSVAIAAPILLLGTKTKKQGQQKK